MNNSSSRNPYRAFFEPPITAQLAPAPARRGAIAQPITTDRVLEIVLVSTMFVMAMLWMITIGA
jgi:hypothetical protein